jgi:hypothetical protein
MRELEHSEKVGFMIFPAAHQVAEVVKPGEEAFDFPCTCGARLAGTVRMRTRTSPFMSS